MDIMKTVARRKPGDSIVVLSRNAESDSESGKPMVIEGQLNMSHITKRGRKQSVRGGKLLLGIRFDCAYSSAMYSAQETLEILLRESDNLGGRPIDVTYDPRLSKRHAGTLQGMKWKTAEAFYGKQNVISWMAGYMEKAGGGESQFDVNLRVGKFFDDIAPRMLAGKNMLIVGHLGSIRAAAAIIEGLGVEEEQTTLISNASPIMYLLRPAKDAWKVVSRVEPLSRR